MDEREIWRPVVGWEGLYEVSNLGNIRSLDRTIKTQRGTTKYTKKIKGSTLTPQKDKYGYSVVHMRDSYNRRNRLLKMHRIVAEAFVSNHNNYDCIDHINGIRDDNRAENLRWCTVSQNANFELAHKNRSISIKESYNRHPELRDLRARTLGRTGIQPIIAYKDGIEIGKFDAIVDFCNEYGLKQSYFMHGIHKCGSYKGYTIKRLPKC